jgi:alpha-beta hydrolase superfamily lysophospholipase
MGRRCRDPRCVIILLVICLWPGWPATAAAQSPVPFEIRGRTLTLRMSGPPTGDPVIVSSGDGGWIHLAPQAADTLARTGFRVVGLDSRQYLSAFTSSTATLSEGDVARDFGAIVTFASGSRGKKPILVGVSEGAGLSVLAAATSENRRAIRGVVGLGLPDLNELGWRWRDAVIYFTKGVPNEPTFSAARFVGRLAPIPLAAIHSTHDEFVPVDVIRRLMESAGEPKRLWLVEASDHRFSGNEEQFRRALLEALAWVKAAGR